VAGTFPSRQKVNVVDGFMWLPTVFPNLEYTSAREVEPIAKPHENAPQIGL